MTEAGHTLNLARINTRFSLRVGRHDLFGWPFLSWVFVPVGLHAWRRRAQAWLVASLLPVLVLLYALYWVGAWLYGPRYYIEALGALAVLSAAGITALALERALVIVHPQTAWTEYGALLRLTPPFADGDLLLAYTRGTETDRKLAQAYADRPVFHYYPGDPPHLVPFDG